MNNGNNPNLFATIDQSASNTGALNAPGTGSFPITPGTPYSIIPRQVHCGGAAGTIIGYLQGDVVNGVLQNGLTGPNTFYIILGGALSYRFIQVTGGTVTGLIGIP
jgi:hypothetical protein